MGETGQRGGKLLLLRWILFLAAALVVLHTADAPVSRSVPWVFVLLAGATALHLLPRSIVRHTLLEPVLVLVDVLLVALVLVGSVPTATGLLAAFFAATMLGALSFGMAPAGVPGVAVAVVYAGFAALAPGGVRSQALVLLPALTLIAAGSVYAGELVGRMRARTREASTERQRSAELRSLLEITDVVTKTLDLQQVMRRIVTNVGRQVEADRCSILLVDEDDTSGFVVAASDNPEADMLEIELEKYPEIQTAIETREPVVVEDVERDPVVAPVRDALTERGYRSLMVLPLVFGSEVLGTLFLRATRGSPFSEREMRFCRVAAGASANALKNALLYREVSREAARHRETWDKLRRVLDCSPDMIVATDIEGGITEYNRGAEALTGVDGPAARGRKVWEVLGQSSPPEALCDGPAERTRLDLSVRSSGGEDKEVSLEGAPLTGPEGERMGGVWVGRDVTQQRKSERRLAEAERLSSIGELAAGVAHELNNPLSAVLGYSQLVQTSAAEPDLIHDLQRIETAARRCQRIVHNLLSFARKHPSEKRFADVNECVRSVLELKHYHLRAADIEVVDELDPDLPPTLFDFHQIEQVVLNLLTNAEQAIAATRSSGTVTVRSWSDGDEVHLEVLDDGPGVPQDLRTRIFDPFFTTKEPGKGTGLGLAVSYGIVREHSGRVELVEEPGGDGARFRVSLPLVEEPDREVASADAPFPDDRCLFEGRRILVAEDEPDVCQLLARLLEQDGAAVTLARDGQEAWEMLTEDDFDLIVADLRMPRLDGQGLYERTAAERPDLARRFVFSTGDLVREDSLTFLERLPNRILAKPLDLETVRRVLHQALSGMAI